MTRGFTLNMSRFLESNPTSTLSRFSSVRRNRPAPTSSTSDIATCSTTRPLLRTVREPVTLRLLSFIAPARSTRVARRAGRRPKTIPVSMLTPARNPNTRQSSGAFWPNGSNARSQYARSPPSAPPRLESRMLSVSSWRISRPRVAPIERRTEISRDRAVARVSRRLATLAQTISSTITTTTPRKPADRRVWGRTS